MFSDESTSQLVEDDPDAAQVGNGSWLSPRILFVVVLLAVIGVLLYNPGLAAILAH